MGDYKALLVEIACILFDKSEGKTKIAYDFWVKEDNH